jgi:formylglycine-generating enzyme required for sulfatase activity
VGCSYQFGNVRVSNEIGHRLCEISRIILEDAHNLPEAKVNNSKTFILGDLPAKHDLLDFTPYVNTLVDIITSPTTITPLTIGIFGTWGTGKTSLMRMVEKGLPKSFRTVWFNAWIYDREETLWRALLLNALTALKEAIPEDKVEDIERLDNLQTALYQPVDLEKIGGLTVEWGKLGRGAAESAVQVGLTFVPGGTVIADLLKELRDKNKTEQALSKVLTAVHRERAKVHIDQVKFLEQFREQFEVLTNEYLVKKNLRLIVFVDDLDRCMPEKSVEVLESIKLFLDTPGCVFIIGVDQNLIARGVEIKYHNWGGEIGNNQGNGSSNNLIDGTRYLEKIIQLPFQIPPIERGMMTTFVNSLVGEWPHPACPQIFSEGLHDNPRLVKRTVNVFLLLWNLAQKRFDNLQGLITPVRLAKLVTIQAIYPELYDMLKETPRYLRDLEDYYVTNFSLPTQKLTQAGRKRNVELPAVLTSFSAHETVRRILTLHPPDMPDANFSDLTPEDIRRYFTLTRRTEIANATKNAPRLFFEPQMIHIPAGSFIMGSTDEQFRGLVSEGVDSERVLREFPQHLVDLSDYYIGKYLVTNREYQAFIIETGYQPPAGWNSQKYLEDKGDHPVVNISWEACVEYCKWLKDRTGKNYRLPTEAEWEKAARGTDGRTYPWGNKFDLYRCNTTESKLGDTTPAGQYSPQGDSPYGCADMAGNVWEWCSDWFDPDEYDRRKGSVVKDPKGPAQGQFRVVRGGSFILDRTSARCAVRFRMNPFYWFDFGFRVAMDM